MLGTGRSEAAKEEVKTNCLTEDSLADALRALIATATVYGITLCGLGVDGGDVSYCRHAFDCFVEGILSCHVRDRTEFKSPLAA
jgi:hypothetical protein